jgi:hypothetical protein
MLNTVVAGWYGALVGCLYLLVFVRVTDCSWLVGLLVGIYLIGSSAVLGGLMARLPSMTAGVLAVTIPLIPFVLLLSVALIVAATGALVTLQIVLLAISPVLVIGEIRSECRFMAKMKSQGRVITRKELLSRLRANKGTLIAKLCHKGIERFWWTEDDLEELGVYSVPFGVLGGDYLDALWDAEDEIDEESALRCDKEYLDVETGKALFVPWRGLRWDRLAREYPEYRIVILGVR